MPSRPGGPFWRRWPRRCSAATCPCRVGRSQARCDLADTTLYLPTRRATRALQEAFLKVSGGGALLLPRIKPIAEGSEDLDLIASVEDFSAGGGGADVPRVISELERQLVLTTLVLRWAQAQARGPRRSAEILPYAATGARTPAQAARLARELARLIDTLEIEDIDPVRLARAGAGGVLRALVAHAGVPADRHRSSGRRTWPSTTWCRRLRGASACMRAEVERLQSAPPRAPVIVAGVTSADPAASELIARGHGAAQRRPGAAGARSDPRR